MMPWLLAAPKINSNRGQGVDFRSHLETENGRRLPRLQQKAPLNTHRISQKQLLRASEAPSSDGGVSLPIYNNSSVQNKLREERKREFQDFLKTQAEKEKLTKRLPASSCTPMKARHLNILDNSSKAWLPSLTPAPGPEKKPTPSRRHISTQTKPMDLENHPQQTCVCGRRVPLLGAAATRARGPKKCATPGVPATYWTPDDAADYVYGARNPVELHLPDIEGRFLLSDGLSGSDGQFGNIVNPSQRTPRLKSRDHLERTPRRGTSPLALMKPHQDKQSRESQQNYQEALRQQIREKEEQKNREKEKMKEEMLTYDPWGRGGCGAPKTTHKGDVFGFSNEPSQEKIKYQQVLKQQMEEKRRMKEEESERLRIEEEKEEKRLAVERALLQQKYEQEKQKKMELKKTELRSLQNQNPTIQSKTPRQELQKRKRWQERSEEVRQSIAKERPQFDGSERDLGCSQESFVSTPQRRANPAGASQTQVGQQEMVRVLPSLRNSSKDKKRLELQRGQRSPEGPPQTAPTRERKEQKKREKETMEDEMSTYQQGLKQQMEEKRRMKEEESERLRIEKEEEEKRLVVERALLQQKYEQEKQMELNMSLPVPAVQKKLAGGVEFKAPCLESQLSSRTESFVSTPQRQANPAGASPTQVGQQEMVRVLPNLRNSSKDKKRLELQRGQRSPEGPPQTAPTRERKEQKKREKEKMEDEMSTYQQGLKQQMEEKRRMKEEESERLRIEEEEEEKRLVVERALLQQKYEQEKQMELNMSLPVPAVQKKLAGGVEFKAPCLESQLSSRTESFVSTPQRQANPVGASPTQVGQQEMVRVLPNLRNSSKDEKRLELQRGQRSPEGPPQTAPTRERKEHKKREKEKMEDEMSTYQQVLKQQMEEKRRMKEEESERLRIEEEEEEKRLVVERALLQQKYEQEKQKKLKKSLPIPAVQKKLAGGVEFKASCLESQQHGRLRATKPRPGSSDAVKHREAHFPLNLEPLHCRSPRMSKSHIHSRKLKSPQENQSVSGVTTICLMQAQL